MTEELRRLLGAFGEGDKRACARAISLVEDEAEEATDVLNELYPLTGRAYRVGITGPPGAGKSTLVEKLAQECRNRGHSVGIVAVDPSSPFSGGAVLGDRIRMVGVQNDPNVYIRSVGSRGSLGGLSAATANIVRVLEVFGVDFMIIETVGMGQTGFDIADLADTVALILSPESGDGVQTMKAGLMEVADIYAVNKADRAGAEGLVTEIVSLLGLLNGKTQWRPPVLKMSALKGEGVTALLEACSEHLAFLERAGLGAERRRRQTANEIRFIVEARVRGAIERDAFGKLELDRLAERVQRKELDAYAAADQLTEHIVASLNRHRAYAETED